MFGLETPFYLHISYFIFNFKIDETGPNMKSFLVKKGCSNQQVDVNWIWEALRWSFEFTLV
jgi:hypothetical protein